MFLPLYSTHKTPTSPQVKMFISLCQSSNLSGELCDWHSDLHTEQSKSPEATLRCIAVHVIDYCWLSFAYQFLGRLLKCNAGDVWYRAFQKWVISFDFHSVSAKPSILGAPPGQNLTDAFFAVWIIYFGEFLHSFKTVISFLDDL